MSIEKLNNCIRNNNVNNSRAREAIYNLLLSADKCLTAAQILKMLAVSYPKKISQNTLYRNLGFLIECKLAITIQDDFKRAYYSIKSEKMMFFCVCTLCNKISKLPVKENLINEELSSADFITVHKECDTCANKHVKITKKENYEINT